MLTSRTIALLSLLAVFPTAFSHGLVSWPRQRGLMARNDYNLPELNPSAEPDYCPHCLNGGGKGTVQQNAVNNMWTPYEPTNSDFLFREDHAICGDAKGGTDHKAPDGRYVSGDTIATYEQGDYIDMEAQVNAHHNGFFEFFACSLDCCGTDDIEKKCFQNGCCKKLMRVPHKSCESGHDRICGPVDPNYPGRWYLPPRDETTPEDNWYGGLNKKMRYALPADMTCDRCVIHWSWTTANSCNPPGYADYKFPQKWAGILGDGGSQGSINRGFGTCGDSAVNFPEEFWTCSENVRVLPPNGGKSRTMQTFHNGRMNIEGPKDATSDQLGKPLEEPENNKPSGNDENAAEKPKESPTSTPPPSSDPIPTPTAAEELPHVPTEESPKPSNNTRSKYDLMAYIRTYDTGLCVRGSRDDRSFCEACLNLGYGSFKCLWCHVSENGDEICTHRKPRGARS